MTRRIAGSPHALIQRFVRLALLPIVAAGCSTLLVDSHNLEGTSWRAMSVDGRAPILGSEPTLKFDGGLLHGSMGCNTYSSQQPVKINNGWLQIGTTLATLGRCVETGGEDAPVMDIELAFQDALRAASRIDFRGDQLVVTGAAGEIVFNRQP